MGTDKALLRVADDLLIERQLRCLPESGAAELPISERPEVSYSCFVASIVHDRLPLAKHRLRVGRYSMQEFVAQAQSEGFILPLELEPAEYIYFTHMNLPSEWAEISNE
jgi:hypothetical protein